MNDKHVIEYLDCTFCKARLRSDRLARHLRKVHSSRAAEDKKNKPPFAAQTEYEGLNIIQALKKGEQWYLINAASVSSCEDCRKKITLLQVGENKFKKFSCQKVSVGYVSNWLIRDTHDCDEQTRGNSVYAYNGGIIDSNRRRH
jgi:hypothetical protein